MAYTKNADGTVTLDTGQVVTVSISQERLETGQVGYTATATCGDINVVYPHTAESVDDNVAKEMLLMVLGEEVTNPTILVTDDVRRQVSIRNHIAIQDAPTPNAMSLL